MIWVDLEEKVLVLANHWELIQVILQVVQDGLLICYGNILAGNGLYESKGSNINTTTAWVTSSGGGSINLFANILENKELILWDVSSPVSYASGSRRKWYI